ncbi:hypothetical protein [uncultured Aureimonas sp.]|uniref:hypothetical protein n=1 Tax=uncultured Aureimonas sp. TaxID=1604662 RepID=UPI0025D71A1E|nr:hypothetical protein [uncultured Aureimonas sp.]
MIARSKPQEPLAPRAALRHPAQRWLRDHLAVYDTTPSGDIRRHVTSGSFAINGDAALSVDAMIEAGDVEHPPLRLALGSTAYENIEAALVRRLEAIRAQKPSPSVPTSDCDLY